MTHVGALFLLALQSVLAQPKLSVVVDSSKSSCEMYSGESICNSSRAGKSVFVDRDPRYSQKNLTVHLRNIYDTAEEAGGIIHGVSLECKEALASAFCYIYFPNCRVVSNHSVERFSICHEDCLATLTGSPNCFKNADDGAYGRLVIAALQLQPSVLGDFQGNCGQFPTVKESNGTCVNIGLADLSTTPMPSSQAATIQSQSSFLPNNCSLDNCSEETDSSFPIVIVASGASGALVIIIILVVILIICTCRRRRKSRNETYDTQTGRRSHPNGFPLVPLRPSLWDSDTETKIRNVAIDPDRLQIQDIIGEGSFGKVYKCLLDSSQTVAAKSVKIDPGSDSTKETQSFVMEALRMTDLNHPNVMNLLGICWSPNSDNVRYTSPLVVLPYMMLGDLRTHLRGKRIKTTSHSGGTTTSSNESTPENSLPTTVELVQFGYQVAKGMEYLSARSIVHRDLAARNCMVDWDLKIRVADFGLARALQEDKDYYRMNPKGARIPIRWCALESLTDGLFTIKTDTWSYGVTLWEIMSLGKMPYPGVAVQDIVSFLERGDRLDRPSNCPEEIYEVMNQCWLTEAGERPSFEEIAETLGDYLGTNLPDGYLAV